MADFNTLFGGLVRGVRNAGFAINGVIEIPQDGRAADVGCINGTVVVGERASVASITLVNGMVSVGAAARVRSGIQLTNGSVNLAKKSRVQQDITTVCGKIRLAAAQVSGSIRTVAADIDLAPLSNVAGDVVIGDDSGLEAQSASRPPVVVIHRQATVKGSVTCKRETRLFIHERARVGSIHGATPTYFSGDAPP